MTSLDVVRHPRARRMKLSVDPVSGRVRLTLPRRAPLAPALAWAEDQRDWIDANRLNLPAARPFVPGAVMPLGDNQVTLIWRAGSRIVRREDDMLVCGGAVEAFEQRIARWYRREALRVLSAETQEYAAKANVVVNRVAIGDPRARWGSCSSSGAIRYSWRLILAPAFVRRATVAHEVAHRVHMNHAPAFHALTARLLESDPAPARRWLRANGAALHWIGRSS